MLPTFLTAYLVAVAATPVAIRVARRIDLLDHPVGYKKHPRPTPYLGGAVLLVGLLAGGLVYGGLWDSRLAPILAGAAFLWLIGTIDDRSLLRPWVRVLAVVLVAVLLWDSGLGWSLFPGDAADLLVTVLWVLGIVNAFNLMDNLDGAAGTVGAVSAAGIALVAVNEGGEDLVALAVALSAACIGFLHFNLTRPARIFLGDGGSMLIGFVIAALAMAVCRLNGMIGPAVLPAIMLAGLPILDMTMVIVSRLRCGAPVGKGRRDHITHRLLPKVGSTWAVAAVLAVSQGVLSLAAIQLMAADRETILAGAAAAFVVGLVTIVILETPLFRPAPAETTSESPGTRRGRSQPPDSTGPLSPPRRAQADRGA